MWSTFCSVERKTMFDLTGFFDLLIQLFFQLFLGFDFSVITSVLELFGI